MVYIGYKHKLSYMVYQLTISYISCICMLVLTCAIYGDSMVEFKGWLDKKYTLEW